MGGYECADMLNQYRQRVDLLTDTGHLELITQDYDDIKPFGIHTVREGIRWSVVEQSPGHYDWTPVEKMIRTGKAKGIQQIWDICHFGYPGQLSPLDEEFADRFVAVCRAFVKFYRSISPDDTLIITPINEVSFISWLGGEAAETIPYSKDMGWEIKYRLMSAYIKGINAIKSVDSSVLILTTEPLVNLVPHLNATTEEIDEAARQHEFQYQAVDILCGKICAELGGSPDLVDILGLNFYYNNQWVIGLHEFLPWFNDGNDPRWRPLHDLLTEVYNRYNKPLILSETSHSGDHRPNWLEFISKECAKAIQNEIPLWGVCLYPIIDRPDWNDPSYWHKSALWDAEHHPGEPPRRILHQPYAEELKSAAFRIDNARKQAMPIETDLS
jgi:beta-glucosidase/6-phospho-beta-glucosidase/beta-galactosidase